MQLVSEFKLPVQATQQHFVPPLAFESYIIGPALHYWNRACAFFNRLSIAFFDANPTVPN
jgi:hypothetical protein